MTPNFVLLLGAGFSRNWGGWLSSEVFEYLIGHPEVQKHPELVRLLWDDRTKGGFEATLERVQAASRSQPKSSLALTRNTLQSAIAQMFDDMNRAFFSREYIEPTSDPSSPLKAFLQRFDVIFTLNQDLLLERHYIADRYQPSSPSRRWSAVELPGIKEPDTQSLRAQDWLGATWRVDSHDFKVAEGIQPLFKLHGSSRWIASDDSDLLVMGGGKESTIAAHAILRRYFEEFDTWLSRPNTRIMTIGFGFRDEHICRRLLKACQRGAHLYVVDPLGVDVLNSNHGIAPLPQWHPLRDYLVGASRRSLLETFVPGSVELGKILRFFDQ